LPLHSIHVVCSCYRCNMVLDASVNPAKTAEPIKVLSGVWTRVGTKTIHYSGGTESHSGNGHERPQDFG